MNSIVHCQYGLDPTCPCGRNFSADRSRLLTEKQAKVGIASFIRSEIERSGKRDPKYILLTRIIKCDEDERADYIQKVRTAVWISYSG